MKQRLNFKTLNLGKILSVFQKNTADIRIVGGAVRDKLLSISSSDIDLATPLLPKEVIEILNKDGIKTVPTGIEYGTVTAVYGESNFEITTLRQDISTDGRYAIVKYTDSYEIDASRRDFTINALSYDPLEEKIYDYFGGLEDLKNREVKFIGIPDERIKEDYLRIMRFFRFSAFYSNKLDKISLEACKNNILGLAAISKERIHNEICKILSCQKNIAFCLKAIKEIGLFEVIEPNHHFNLLYLLKFESDFELLQKHGLDLNKLRLALLLFSTSKKSAIDCLKKLKFSNAEILANDVIHNYISSIITLEDKEEIVLQICRVWYYFPGYIKEFLVIAYLLDKINFNEMKENLKFMNQEPPKMPIKSQEIIDQGYEGLSLGIRIKFLESKWIKSGFSVQKEVLMSLK